MNVIKKVFKNPIFMFILGGLCFGSLTVFALSVNSNEVLFTPSNENWAVDNVEDAINDLYNKKWSIELIGQDNYDSTHSYAYQHTYDLTSYSNYESFTEDNFILSFTSFGVIKSGSTTSNQGGIIKSYNQETGILTVTLPMVIYSGYGSIIKINVYLITNL